MFSLYPSSSLVQNIGFDGTGTHNKKRDNLHSHNFLYGKKIKLKISKVEESIEAVKFLEKFYRKNRAKMFLNKIKKYFF